MGGRYRAAAVLILGHSITAGGMTTQATAQTPEPKPGPQAAVQGYEPAAFADLPGWAADDHAAAFRAFLKSCARLVEIAAKPESRAKAPAPLIAACRLALGRAGRKIASTEARVFFEHAFTPHRVVHANPRGLLTGYYEPILDGSRVPTSHFSVPVLRRPADLENIVAETDRAAVGGGYSHARRTSDGLVPYHTRTAIEEGALAGQGLELVWLADPVDTFFMHIQGSGRIRLPDGSFIRLAYDGKNGHPYASIGRHLIDQGVIGANAMTLGRLGAWLKADTARGRQVMRHNPSYVFFRELPPAEATAPKGALDIALTPGRSLAVDASLHALGSPVYVNAPTLTHASGGRAFQRLMVAQDVGSAIRGPERGDIYFGSGPACRRAGRGHQATRQFLRVVAESPRNRQRFQMTPGKRGNRRPPGGLTAEEAALWEYVTLDVEPAAPSAGSSPSRWRSVSRIAASSRRDPRHRRRAPPRPARRHLPLRRPLQRLQCRRRSRSPRSRSTAARRAVSPRVPSKSMRASTCMACARTGASRPAQLRQTLPRRRHAHGPGHHRQGRGAVFGQRRRRPDADARAGSAAPERAALAGRA